MRPLRLRMRGFGAFRDQTEVDFDDADVFALVGPTGSGKSTVIDAMCFALYGSVPRHGEKLVDPVVSVGANEAAVDLTFEVAGQRYVVARIVRRTGRDAKATTKEARLERHHPDGTVEILAATARSLLPAVESLIGLSFAHFTRCVVLPQGEFARFLHDKPADRQALLEQLLGLGLYDVMVRQANQRAAEARVAGELAARTLDQLPKADDETLTAARARRDDVVALVAAVAAAQDDLQGLRATATVAAEEAARWAGLQAALETVSVPDVVAELGHRLDEARHELTRAVAAGDQAESHVAAAASRLASLPPDRVLEGVAQAHLRIHRGCQMRAQRVRAADEAGRRHALAAEAVQAAEVAEVEARRALEAVRRAHAAHDLSEHLAVGEPCPVCRQVVSSRPRRARPPTLAAAQRQQSEAERAVATARQAAAAAADGSHRAGAEVAKIDATLAALAEQVVDHPDPEALTALLAEVAAATAEVAAARDEAATAGKAVAVARDAIDQFERGLQKAADAFHAQRDAVAMAGPPAPVPHLVTAWKELAAWAGGEAPAAAARSARATAQAADATAAYDRIVGELTGRAARLDIDVGAGLAVSTVRAEEQAAEAVRDIEAARDEATRLTADVDASRHRYAVAHELGRHLASAGFPRWLVGEALDLLVAEASGLLRRLSGGQYSLVALDDGTDLGVVDHANADEIRPVRSLSGGETFQASLAFALALSDHLAGMGADASARLDAIFLDEGFGSLDADSLETVAATIEALAGGGRMVGIVTHVRELAERVPVRYVVGKGPRTATVERVAS